jgi:hypothetical protein
VTGDGRGAKDGWLRGHASTDVISQRVTTHLQMNIAFASWCDKGAIGYQQPRKPDSAGSLNGRLLAASRRDPDAYGATYPASLSMSTMTSGVR